MSLVRQSIKTQPPFGEVGDPPFQKNAHVLYEEEYRREPINQPHIQEQYHAAPVTQSNNQQQYYSASIAKSNTQEESFIQTNSKRLVKKRSKNELAHADYVERLMIGKITFFLAYPEHEVISYRSISYSKGSRRTNIFIERIV